MALSALRVPQIAMLLPQVFSELIVSAVSLAMASTLGTTWNVAKEFDKIHTMNSLAVASKIRFTPESLIAIAMGTGESRGCGSELLHRVGLIWDGCGTWEDVCFVLGCLGLTLRTLGMLKPSVIESATIRERGNTIVL
jgi:hypothetical protein